MHVKIESEDYLSKQTRFIVVKQDFDQFLQFAEQMGFRSVPEIIESEIIRESELPTDFNVKTSADFFYLIPKPFSAVEAFYKGGFATCGY